MRRTAIAMAEPADINVDELRRRARRRLVGAVVLALGVAVVVPMLLETEQKPLGDDVAVKIPPVDSGKFVNRLNENAPNANAQPSDDAAKATPSAPPATVDAPADRPQKYDTHVREPAPTAQPPVIVSDLAAPKAPGAEGVSSTNAAELPVPRIANSESGKSAAPTSAHAATEAARTASASHPSAQRDGFAVQLAAFADDKGANSLAGRLKKAGYAAYTEPLKTSKGTLWRVRVGPYPSREAAIAARDKLKTEGQSGIVAAIK
jgi:DedD protein